MNQWACEHICKTFVATTIFTVIISIDWITTLGSVLLLPVCKVEIWVKRPFFWQLCDDFRMQVMPAWYEWVGITDYGSSVEDQISCISFSKTVLSIGRTSTQLNNWSGSEAPKYSWMLWTCPFSSLYTLFTLVSFHSFRLDTSFRITMSPTLKFLLESNHFCLSCKVARNSLQHTLQNLLLMCCTCFQHFLQYRSGVPNTSGGGVTTLLFIVNRWLGDSATSLFASLMFSTTRGLEVNVALTSVNKVFRDSSSKLLLWVLRREDKMFLADLTCLSQTLPMWLAKGEFLFHTIQSAFWLNMNL